MGLTPPRPEPADFDEFWQQLKLDSERVSPNPKSRRTEDSRVTTISYTSVGELTIGGWLFLPDGEFASAMVVSHGYGGRESPDLDGIPDGTAAIFPVCRGLPSLSMVDDLPSSPDEHVLHGIESKETYVLGGCAADIWLAATVLEQMLETKLGFGAGGLPLFYKGGSFGGGMGALALPWDSRFSAAALHVPTFGNNPERLLVPSRGSSEAVRMWVRDHPEAWDVLDYFDAVHGASRLRIPTVVAPARRDPAVPPVGQWAVASAIPREHAKVLPMTAGHEPHRREAADLRRFRKVSTRLFRRVVSLGRRQIRRRSRS